MLRKKIHIILTTLLLPAITGFSFSGHNCESTPDSSNACSIQSTCCETLPGDCCYYSAQQSFVANEYVVPVSDTDSRVHANSFLEFIESSYDIRESKQNRLIRPIKKPFADKKHSILSGLQRFLL